MELSSWVETIPPQGFALAKFSLSLFTLASIFIREREKQSSISEKQGNLREEETGPKFQKTEERGVFFLCLCACDQSIYSFNLQQRRAFFGFFSKVSRQCLPCTTLMMISNRNLSKLGSACLRSSTKFKSANIGFSSS